MLKVAPLDTPRVAKLGSEWVAQSAEKLAGKLEKMLGKSMVDLREKRFE